MKRYSAAQARQGFARVLDQAELGEPVIIERRGVRFSVRAEKRARSASRRSSVVDHMDAAVAAGSWEWRWDEQGLGFQGSRSRK